MKNTLIDLNNHLFEQLERLNDEDLQGDKLEAEISRANAIKGIATSIIQNGSLVLQAQKFNDSKNDIDLALPELLEGKR